MIGEGPLSPAELAERLDYEEGTVRTYLDELFEFDLPVRTTALAPIDRRVAAVVAGCVGVIVLAPVAVVLVPALSSSTALLYGVFVLPFATLPLRGLWKRAYPESSTAAESDV